MTMKSIRVAFQHNQSAAKYNKIMLIELEDLDEVKPSALDCAQAYNRRVKDKTFGVGDLVWKIKLPPRLNDQKFGKWSATWKGSFEVVEIKKGGVYH